MNVKTNSDKASEAISSPFAAGQEEEPALELLSSTIGGTATRSETESVVDDIEQVARSYTLHLFEALPVYIFLVGAGVDLNKLGITTTDIQVLKSLTSKPSTDHLKTQIQKFVMHKKDELVSAERALNEAHKTVSLETCFFIMYRPSNCSYVDHFCCLADGRISRSDDGGIRPIQTN